MIVKTSRLSRRVLLIALVAFVLIIGQWVVPGFAGPGQMANQLKIATFLGLFGISQAIVMIAGGQGLDLSVGAVATLGGMVGAAILGTGASGLALSLCIAALCGFAIGVANGVGITVFKVPPLVMTLAMASLVDGGLIVMASVVHANTAATPMLVSISGRSYSGIPIVLLIWVVAAGLTVWFLRYSAWGRRLMATGANPVAARVTGVRVNLVKVGAYAASATVAAVTGVLLVGYVGQAFLGLGNAYVLSSVVIAVIGGVALGGGHGDYVNVAIAAIFVTVLTSLLTAVQIGEASRQIIFGVTLLLFLAANRYSSGKSD